MTVDALLALLLSVAIPTLLALGGGLLAVIALGKDKTGRKTFWITYFIVLTLVAIGLAFVQQVRLTEGQKIVAKEDNAKQLRIESEQRYTQGQLDSINRVLTSVVSSPNLPSTYASTLSGLLSATKQASNSSARPLNPTSLAGISNEELFAQATSVAAHLSAIGAHYRTAIEDASPSYGPHPDDDASVQARVKDLTKAKSDALAAWGDLRTQCDLVLDELHRRIPLTQGHDMPRDRDIEFQMEASSLFDASGFSFLASRITVYADLLPRRK